MSQYLMDAEFSLKPGQFEEKVIRYEKIDIEALGQINHMGLCGGWLTYFIEADPNINGIVTITYRREKTK